MNETGTMLEHQYEDVDVMKKVVYIFKLNIFLLVGIWIIKSKSVKNKYYRYFYLKKEIN